MQTNFFPLLRRVFPVGVLAACAALACNPAAAQQPGAVLVITVRSAATAQPLQGAQVLVRGTGIGGVADAAGTLRLTGLAPGVRNVTVRYLGYAPETRAVELSGERTATAAFVLELQSIPLAEVRVRARPGLRRLASLGFYERKANSPGAFLTRSDIERRRPNRLSDMLRVIPGISLASTGFSDARASMLRSAPGRRCPIQYYLDGVTTHGFNIDDVQPGDIEGIEIYRGSSEVPPAFNRGSALCGVIVIWTRID